MKSFTLIRAFSLVCLRLKLRHQFPLGNEEMTAGKIGRAFEEQKLESMRWEFDGTDLSSY